ncbi:MAG: cytochrome c family protein [Planctomycetes bacterium]|nr:cytochrome c family protein [Planctomycetota bacterium]MBI3833868.1 cytochrome c family protein [Planctomycetota bacterium]
MRYRNTFVVGALLAAGGVVIWQGGRASTVSANPGDLTVVATTAAASAALGPAGDAEYVGSSKCKKCHLAEHKTWEKTPHAKAMETLKPGGAKEAKEKAKLDPQKDYTKDATCVACHTVGFGKPGGYQMPADAEAAKKMEAMENVGCEMCHGPGSKYIVIHEDIMKSKRKYKDDELVAAGQNTKPDKAVCVTCHNEKSPSFDKSVAFDFDKMKAKGVHDVQPLKQRE